MRKKKEKNTRITKLVAETARKIFGSSERLAIIFLLTKKKMNIQEIQKITGGSRPLIFYHFVELEEGLIIEGEYQTLEESQVEKKRLDEIFFKINENIRSELMQIIDSFMKIQNLLKKYKKEKE